MSDQPPRIPPPSVPSSPVQTGGLWITEDYKIGASHTDAALGPWMLWKLIIKVSLQSAQHPYPAAARLLANWIVHPNQLPSFSQYNLSEEIPTIKRAKFLDMKTEVAFAQELPVPPATWINQKGFLELRASLWGESRLRKEDPSSYDQDTDLPCQIALVLLRQTESQVRSRKSRAHTMGVPRFECFCAKGLWVVRILPLTDLQLRWIDFSKFLFFSMSSLLTSHMAGWQHYKQFSDISLPLTFFLSKVPGVRKLYCLLESSLSVFLPFISMRSRLLAKAQKNYFLV